MSSISVRFNSFLSLIRFSMNINPFQDFPSDLLCKFCWPPIPRLVGLDGLEPSTSRLSGVRSSHLSYKPILFCFAHPLLRSFSILSPRLGVDFVDWWRWWGSNPWPPACRAGALPAELHPRFRVCSTFSRISFLILKNWTTKGLYAATCSTSLVIRLRLRQIRENLSWSP